jgi:LPXTG-motif cell wall-anchored protein
VTSRAATTLADLDVLGGLVRLTGFASSAVASATGAHGGAAARATSTVASVQIGDGLLGVALTDSGRLTADVAGLLPPSVVAQVNAALAQVTGAVNQVLSQAGVSVTPAATSHHVAPDGRSADASASGLLVTLQPPGQPKPLLQLGIGAARASAQAQVARVLDERAELPHTGSGLGTTALVGASGALLGGLALRRRLGRAG